MQKNKNIMHKTISTFSLNLFLFIPLVAMESNNANRMLAHQKRHENSFLWYAQSGIPHTRAVKTALMHPAGHILYTVDNADVVHAWPMKSGDESVIQEDPLFELPGNNEQQLEHNSGRLQKLLCSNDAKICVKLFEHQALVNNRQSNVQSSISAPEGYSFQAGFVDPKNKDITLSASKSTLGKLSLFFARYCCATGHLRKSRVFTFKTSCPATDMHMHPTGNFFVFAHNKTIVDLSRKLTGNQAFKYDTQVSKLAFNPQGTDMILGYINGNISIHEVTHHGIDADAHYAKHKVDTAPVQDIKFNAAGDILFIGQPEFFHIWKMQHQSGKYESVYTVSYYSHCLIKELAVSDCGQSLVVLGDNGDTYGIDMDEYAVIWQDYAQHINAQQAQLISQLNEMQQEYAQKGQGLMDFTEMKYIELLQKRFNYHTLDDVKEVWDSFPFRFLESIVTVSKPYVPPPSSDDELIDKYGLDCKYDQG